MMQDSSDFGPVGTMLILAGLAIIIVAAWTTVVWLGVAVGVWVWDYAVSALTSLSDWQVVILVYVFGGSLICAGYVVEYLGG